MWFSGYAVCFWHTANVGIPVVTFIYMVILSQEFLSVLCNFRPMV
jgi:hypothetical protein